MINIKTAGLALLFLIVLALTCGFYLYGCIQFGACV